MKNPGLLGITLATSTWTGFYYLMYKNYLKEATKKKLEYSNYLKFLSEHDGVQYPFSLTDEDFTKVFDFVNKVSKMSKEEQNEYISTLRVDMEILNEK